MSKIRVLHVIKSLGRGGAEMLLPETLKLHDNEKFEFHYIYFLPWKDQMVDSLLGNGGKVTCLSSNNNLFLILKAAKIVKYIRENRIDIVHAHLPWAGLVSRIVGKITTVPVVYTEHNKQERYHSITRFLNLMTMNWQHQIIAVSEDVGQSLKSFKPNLKTSLQIILNGVNIIHFAPGIFERVEKRLELDIPAEAPVIGTVAVFRFQKRLEVWMEVAKEILKNFPDAHFIIVGDGPLKSSLIEKRRTLELEGRVHLVGLQTEVRPYIAALDIYMMSSVFEGLPVALLEAMASGCPVVSTDAGGIKEVVRNEEDGLLCPVNNPEQLVALATRLISDNPKRKLLGMQSRKRIQEKFSMEVMVKKLESLYHSLVLQKRSSIA